MANDAPDPAPRGFGTNRNGTNGNGSGSGTRPRPPGPESPRYRASRDGGATGQKREGGARGPRRWRSLFARRWRWVVVGLLVLNGLITPYLLPDSSQERITVPYTTFKDEVRAGNVSEITSRGDLIQGTFKQP